MPSLLHNAYGGAWGSRGEVSRQLGSSLGTTIPETIETETEQATVAQKPSVPYVPMHVVRRERSYQEPRGGDYVLNLSIRIDQQDCHLLCLFLGVFIFSILFTRNKKLSPASLL